MVTKAMRFAVFLRIDGETDIATYAFTCRRFSREALHIHR
jgi:hypothetical protein